jgi:L-alanine-DL-glutamate epimerase-like enolase superfamily enzyme
VPNNGFRDCAAEFPDRLISSRLTGPWRKKEDFINLCEKHAVSKIHPDISTILETHKIGERAMELGVPREMHYAGTPVGALASVHCAAATANFLACENHSLDVPFWQDLVEGIEKPIIAKGFIKFRTSRAWASP